MRYKDGWEEERGLTPSGGDFGVDCLKLRMSYFSRPEQRNESGGLKTASVSKEWLHRACDDYSHPQMLSPLLAILTEIPLGSDDFLNPVADSGQGFFKNSNLGPRE